MQLYLCEKPSQARDLARVLGVTSRSDGYLHNNAIIITWCFGHLLEMVEPEQYDPAFKRWQLSTLPIIPIKWKMAVRKGARKQYQIILQLLKRSSHVVIATDADREGETIAREVLQASRWSGPITRLWLSALDETSIRKALDNVLPGTKTEPLYRAGLGRARADWLVGMNLTRAYTLLGQQAGYEGVLSVGRVQTPTLNLIVERDRVIDAFTPRPYFEVQAIFEVKAGQFNAKWQAPKQVTDTEGRCTNPSTARTVAQQVTGQQGTITQATTTREQDIPPLPFDLSSLQQAASRNWGMGAKAVLDTAQALYETHKALTYPRTDCRYLPTSQFPEASQVLSALIKSDNTYATFVTDADVQRRSRTWNDQKITAHHAIIPTTTPTDISKMSDSERQIYDLVCRHYVAQFYPAYEYDKTVIEVEVCEHIFRTVGNVSQIEGWRYILGKTDTNPSGKNSDLPAISLNETVETVNAQIETKQTKPPARYTEGTLIMAMKNIGKQVSDPKLKRVLRDTSGIGTEATRASIIETLLQRRFVETTKKHLVSTSKGRSLIDMLPGSIKNPATTALWEQGLDDIAQGLSELDNFILGQVKWIEDILLQIKQRSVSTNDGVVDNDNPTARPCPVCANALQRRRGKNGWFWGCVTYPDCKGALPDNNGQPGTLKQRTNILSSLKKGDVCPSCQTGQLVQRTVKSGKNTGKHFVGCTCFPKCHYFAWPG